MLSAHGAMPAEGLCIRLFVMLASTAVVAGLAQGKQALWGCCAADKMVVCMPAMKVCFQTQTLL